MLDGFLKLLPGKSKHIFEFRHESWYDQDTYDLLNNRGVGFCVHDLQGHVVTNATTLKRLMGA